MYICESETSKSSDYGQAAFKLRINPGMREGMLKYMINIVLSDKLIAKEEVDLLYEFGSQIGLSDIEVATAIGEAIQLNYVPSLESIC